MAKYRLELDGVWELSGRPEPDAGKRGDDGFEFTIPATVPGNIELALFEAGRVSDPYTGMNAQALRPFEAYGWRYRRDFEYDGIRRDCELVFDGLDCFAAVYVNDNRVGDSANALIPQRFPAGEWLRPGRNVVEVRLSGASRAFRHEPLSAATFSSFPYNYEITRIRKPAHVWGWDITPRMALGGIFRCVGLEERPAECLEEGFLQIARFSPRRLTMQYHYKIAAGLTDFRDLRLSLEGVCGDSRWSASEAVWSYQGIVRFDIENPALWWPRHYGEANLYTVTVRLSRGGEAVWQETFRCGLREISLHAAPVCTDAATPDFQFVVNGTPIRVCGCNHVPADALHSRDRERLPRILEMFRDLECNMVRVWGGGVYEDELFYDYCDRNGILIWQDFMMGCANYPNDAAFCDVLRHEALVTVRRLRQHPSLALWAGDNECDCCLAAWGVPQEPNRNRLTREVLPDVCREQDPTRVYLPSSPWYSPEAVEKIRNGAPENKVLAEQHLWGPRDYFKSDFYRNSAASFASEIGYHGCPDTSSIRRFLSPEKLWPWRDNDEWNYHASNPFLPDNPVTNYRTGLMAEQIEEMFGTTPESLDAFARASQFCQAEAVKYFIELFRASPKKSGILWWNLIDCWPQFSDAVVDYYFGKKLAYHFIRRVQRPFAIILPEASAWHQRIVAVNDSAAACSGKYRIWDADSQEEFSAGVFGTGAGEIVELGQVKVCTTRQRLLLIEWQLETGESGVNHALCGYPQFDLEHCLNVWLPQIAALDHTFDADEVGRG